MADRVEYIKIARIDQDGNDLTNTLEALTQITIPYTSGTSPAVYPVQSITRYSEYFLYKVGMANRTPDPNDSGSLDYNFTSSLSTSIFSQDKQPDAQVSVPMIIDGEETQIFTNNIILGALNQAGPIPEGTQITLNTYPQKQITVGFNFTASITSGEAFFKLYKNNGSTLGSVLAQTSLLSAGTHEETLSVTLSTASISPRDGFSLVAHMGGPVGFTFEGSFNSNSHFFASSSAATGLIKEITPEPYLTSRFYGGDCDILLNNVELYRENPFLQDIDYSTDPNTPVNFDLIISGTAARGTVPESYYTALSSINLKYNGSKVQSQDFNIYRPLGFGGLTTTDFGDPINIGTYGQTPSVSSLDANIYEFEWGGGTTPEIVGYGAVKMGRILQVSSKNQVQTINASDGVKNIIIPSKQGHRTPTATNYRQVDGLYPPESVNTMSIEVTPSSAFPDGKKNFWLTTQSISDYYQILNGNNPVNSEISMYMYPNSTAGSNPTLPPSTKILTTEWGVPTISNYALTSSFTESLASASVTVNNYGWIRNGNANIYLYRHQHISRVTTDANGYYNAGSEIAPNWSTLGNEINKDLNNGEKWFVTLFEEFEFPNGGGDYNSALTTGSLTPYNTGFTGKDSNGNYSSPLAFKGVFEILGTDDTFSNYFYILTDQTFTENRNIGGNNTANTPLSPFGFVGSIGGNSLGMLIWKARAAGKNEFVIVQDSITGGVQGGAFTSAYTPDYIIENFESITKEYGSNQTG